MSFNAVDGASYVIEAAGTTVAAPSGRARSTVNMTHRPRPVSAEVRRAPHPPLPPEIRGSSLDLRDERFGGRSRSFLVVLANDLHDRVRVMHEPI